MYAAAGYAAADPFENGSEYTKLGFRQDKCPHHARLGAAPTAGPLAGERSEPVAQIAWAIKERAYFRIEPGVFGKCQQVFSSEINHETGDF